MRRTSRLRALLCCGTALLLAATSGQALLLAKYVGFQYGQDTPVNAYPIKPYTTVDFAAGYTLPILNGRTLDFRLNVNNLFDNHSLIGLNQLAADGKTGLYWTNPGRSVFFSVAARL